jgi:hypothetical protein
MKLRIGEHGSGVRAAVQPAIVFAKYAAIGAALCLGLVASPVSFINSGSPLAFTLR